MISSYFANFPLLKASKMPFYSKFLNIFSSPVSILTAQNAILARSSSMSFVRVEQCQVDRFLGYIKNSDDCDNQKYFFSDKLPFTIVKFVHFSPLFNSYMLHFATLTRKIVFFCRSRLTVRYHAGSMV